LEIPYKPEPMPRRSGTDADSLQTVAHGIPTMVIGIPLRYMHSAVEIISLKDIQRTARLLTEFIARLEVDYLDKIKWDETN
jgi:endoglucanase